MPGPKYVDNFQFPSDFGFTGSASDRSTVPVRPHERARPKARFAEGGKVVKPTPDKDTQIAKADPPPPKNPPKGDTILVPSQPNNPIDELKNQRARQMKELGLKRGGKVKAAKIKFGARPSPSDPDNVTAPMLKRGGKLKRAMGGPVQAKGGGKMSKRGKC